VFLLLPVQRRIDEFSERLQARTIERLEETIDREISYRSMSPSILLFLEIRGIEVKRRGDGRNLALETIRVHYSFPELLRGNIADSVNTVRIIDSTVRLDRRKDAPLIADMRSILKGGGESDGEIPRLVVNGENVTVFYTTSEGAFDLRNFFFSARYDREEERYDIEGRGRVHGELKTPMQIADFAVSRGESRFSFRSSITPDFSDLNARLTLRQFDSDLLSFSGLTIELIRDESRTVLRKIEDSSPWDLQLVLNQETETLTGSLRARDFVPADNIQAQSGLEPYGEWLSTNISGEASFTAGLDGSLHSYRGDLELFIKNSSLPQPLTADLEAEGDLEKIRFERLRVETKSARARFRGRLPLDSLLPSGSLWIDRLQWQDYRVSGRCDLRSRDNELTVTAPQLSFNTLWLKEFSSSIRLMQDEVEFDFETRIFGARAQADEGGIAGQGTYNRSNGNFLDISMHLESVALAPALEAGAPDGMPGDVLPKDLHVSSELYFSTDFERYSFSLLPLRISNRDESLVFQASVSGNNESVIAEQVSLQTNDRNFRGRVQMSRLQGSSLNFQAEFSHRNRNYSFEGLYRQPSTILLRGNHGLRGTVFFRNDSASFNLRASSYPLPLGEQFTELSLNAAGEFRSAENWQLRIRELRAVGLPGVGQNSSLELALSANAETVQLTEVQYRDGLSTLEGEAEIRNIGFSPPQGDVWIRMNSRDGEESYRGIVSFQTQQLKGRISAQGFPLARVKTLPMRGTLDTTVDIHGTRKSPQLDYSLQVEDAQYNSASVAFSAEGTATPQEMKMKNMNAEFRNHLFNEGAVELRIPSGEFSLEGQYRGILQNRTAEAAVNASGTIEKLQSIRGLTKVPAKNVEANIRFSEFTLFQQQLDPWEFRFSKKESVHIVGGPEDSVSGTMRPDGSFDFDLRAPLPLRVEGSGSLAEGQIAMNLRNLWVDMEVINNFGIEMLDFKSGIIAGGLDIEGPTGDPEFFGELFINEASFGIDYVKGTIRPFSTTVSISGKTGTFEATEIQAGEQRVRLSGGMQFDRWTPDSLRIVIRTLSPKGVETNYVIERSGLIARGFARGTFSYAMDGNMNRIEGDLELNDFTITMQDKGPPPLMGKQQYSVDLELSTGSNVQFLWPRSNFPILRAYLKTGQEIHITYQTNPESYSIRGDVGLRGGEIYYFQRNFYLTEGAIHLNEDENAFNPLLELRARIREVDMEGQPVTIFMIVENEPLKTFTPRFESQPVMATTEIIQLLGGQLYAPLGSPQGELTSALLLTGDVVSQFGIIQTFEQRIKDTLQLDLFSVRTQMIQNVILERVLNRPLLEGEQQLTTAERYLDNTTLFLGKYVGNDLFLQGMVQLRRRPVIETGEIGEEGLSVNMEIGFEWQTPLFLLDFSINPVLSEPKQSIYNTSLGFSWDYSY